MNRITSLVYLALLIIFVSVVVDQARAEKICEDGLGLCGDDCDQRCKAKHGPTGEASCDRMLGVPLCTCYWDCTPPRAPPQKMCNGGAGLCSANCPESCCDGNCARKFAGGHGFCVTLGTSRLCQCQYPC